MKKIVAALILSFFFASVAHADILMFMGRGFPIWQFNVVSTQTIAGVFQTNSASNKIVVAWGDGTSNTYAGTSDQAYSKTYSASGNYTVRVYASSAAVLTKFTMTTSGANIAFDIGKLPSGMVILTVTGANTIFGGLTALPGALVSITIAGYNTISGALTALPSNVVIFAISGISTISSYTTRTWKANSMQQVYLIFTPPGGLSQTDVDQLLVDLAASGTWVNPKVVTLTGTNAAPSSTGLAAVTTLQAAGVTVTHN